MNSDVLSSLLSMEGGLDNPLPLFLLMAALSLVPFIVLGVTSFVKLSVVFGILKNAIGAQQVPSGAVVSLLSFALTIHIMSPVLHQVLEQLSPVLEAEVKAQPKGKASGMNARVLITAIANAREPLLDFLAKHSSLREREFFISTAYATRSMPAPQVTEGAPACEGTACRFPGEGFLSLIPAFVISELHEAFAIGFTVFLPFLILDLIVANLLVSLGMTMMSPATVSLPFKVMLFVLCDTWFLLSKGLILGYA